MTRQRSAANNWVVREFQALLQMLEELVKHLYYDNEVYERQLQKMKQCKEHSETSQTLDDKKQRVEAVRNDRIEELRFENEALIATAESRASGAAQATNELVKYVGVLLEQLDHARDRFGAKPERVDWSLPEK